MDNNCLFSNLLFHFLLAQVYTFKQRFDCLMQKRYTVENNQTTI